MCDDLLLIIEKRQQSSIGTLQINSKELRLYPREHVKYICRQACNSTYTQLTVYGYT